MGLFTKIEGAVAITRRRGVYNQVDIYSRGGSLYVKVAGGYAALYATMPSAPLITSMPDLAIEELIPPPGWEVTSKPRGNGLHSICLVEEEL